MTKSDSIERQWLPAILALSPLGQEIQASLKSKKDPELPKNDPRNLSITITNEFVRKATTNVTAVGCLFEQHLWEPAQTISRVLLENFINFAAFEEMKTKDANSACERYMHAVTLGELKRQRLDGLRSFELAGGEQGKEVADLLAKFFEDRYGREEVRAMEKHGFTGVPLAERAKRVKLEEFYNGIYRPFSANIHSQDIFQHLASDPELPTVGGGKVAFSEGRNNLILYTAFLSAGQVFDVVDRSHSCGVGTRLYNVTSHVAAILASWLSDKDMIGDSAAIEALYKFAMSKSADDQT